MSTAEIHVALPLEIAEAVQRAIETGEFVSSDEVIRAALQEWIDSRDPSSEAAAALSRRWHEAVTDRRSGVPADEVLDRLERKYRAMVDGASAV